MFSKRELKMFLEESCAGAKFLKFDFVSTEKFSINLKCKVEKDATAEFYSQYSGEWIKRFSTFTATTWIVRNCFSKLKRLLYRKVFACHRSAFNKRKKPQLESRNQNCKAKIEFKMKFINKNTIKNDHFLKEDLNLTISIDFTHTHKVRAPEAFNLLKSTSDTDNIFQRYFDTNCTAAAAKYYHELTLIDKYGENCPEVLANANVNPSLRHILYIHGKRKKEMENRNFKTILESKKEILENGGCTLSFTEDPETIVIITPIMKRVITEFGLENVIIDSTVVPYGPVITFYYVPSKVGALPAVCAIHTERSKDNFFQAFYTAKLVLEMEFNKNLEPAVLVLSDFKVQKVVSSLYPKATLVMSHRSLCCDTWRWLQDDENKIESKKRHDLMEIIQSLICAKSSEEAEKIFNEIKDSSSAQPEVNTYVDRLWDVREQWLHSNSEHESNLVEASIRFTKEFFTKRCKSMNHSILVDVVTHIFENHMRRTLMTFVKESDSVELYTKFLTKSETVLGVKPDIKSTRPNEFRVVYQQKPKRHFYFRTSTMCCDCINGRRGNLCEHLCAFFSRIDSDAMKIPTLDEEEKLTLAKLAQIDIDEDIKNVKAEYNNDFNIIEIDDMEKAEFADDRDTISDEPDIEEHKSVASSPKSNISNDYFHIEVKTERCDPLEDEFELEQDIPQRIAENVAPSHIPRAPDHISDIKKQYETTLKAMNDEFRRLNRFFSENPNSPNLETMTRLARELSKIKPIEKVNLSSMRLKLNNRKKKLRDQLV